VLGGAIAAFLVHKGGEAGEVSTRPRAYVSWLLLDEQLRPVITGDGKNSGFEQVGAPGELKIHEIIGRECTRSGYLYIYTSNETPGRDVFFDNLQVSHVRGPLLEETHYYSRAAGGMENRKKYNGIEFTEDLGLDVYDAFYRNLDAQTGRWWQIDPKIEKMEAWSPYASNFDNPIAFSDPLGDEPGEGCPTCPIINPTILAKGSEIATELGNAIGSGLSQILVSAGGVLNGALNTLTLGAWPTNPAEVITGSNSMLTDDADAYKTSVSLGQAAAMITPLGRGANRMLGLELVTVDGQRITAQKAPLVTSGDRMNSNSLEGSKQKTYANESKQSKAERSIKTEGIGNGKYTKTTEVRPGKGPGQSRAEYVRFKNQFGKVIKTQKFTYDRANKFQHKKPLRGGPEGRKQNE
jgi:RHS repeat-associated protein